MRDFWTIHLFKFCFSKQIELCVWNVIIAQFLSHEFVELSIKWFVRFFQPLLLMRILFGLLRTTIPFQNRKSLFLNNYFETKKKKLHSHTHTNGHALRHTYKNNNNQKLTYIESVKWFWTWNSCCVCVFSFIVMSSLLFYFVRFVCSIEFVWCAKKGKITKYPRFWRNSIVNLITNFYFTLLWTICTESINVCSIKSSHLELKHDNTIDDHICKINFMTNVLLFCNESKQLFVIQV